MDQFIIRLAAPRDVDAIAELWEGLVAYHRALDAHLPTASSNGAMRYARRVLDHLEDPIARVFVAEQDDQVIGYVLGVIVELSPEMFTQEMSGFLADIYVDEVHRRGGVGRALVDALVGWFTEKGLLFYEWHAAARNEAGIAFWEAMNGRVVMLRMRAEIGKPPS